jgi:hypothetical protein
MVSKKRCFMSIRALRRLDERLLCEMLRKFPGYLRDCGIELPDPLDRTAMNYLAIHAAWDYPSIPAELVDVHRQTSASRPATPPSVTAPPVNGRDAGARAEWRVRS